MKGIAREWTKEQNDYIKANLGKLSNMEIARNLNVPYPTFDNYLISQGLKTVKSKYVSVQEQYEEQAARFKRNMQKLKQTLSVGDKIQGYPVISKNNNVVVLQTGNYRQAYTWADALQAKMGRIKLSKQRDEDL